MLNLVLNLFIVVAPVRISLDSGRAHSNDKQMQKMRQFGMSLIITTYACIFTESLFIATSLLIGWACTVYPMPSTRLLKMVSPTSIFKSKTCIFYKNRISEAIEKIFGTTVYCHSNTNMVFLFVQNFIFTVINPLIPTCKKWVIFIKFWWAP